MSQSAAVQSMIFSKEASEKKHRFRLLIAWIVSLLFIGAFAAYGFDYYTLPWKDRPFSPKHMLLRPSGLDRRQSGSIRRALYFSSSICIRCANAGAGLAGRGIHATGWISM